MNDVVEQTKDKSEDKSAAVADDDLDALLNEFDKENNVQEPVQQQTEVQTDDFKTQLQQFMQEQRDEKLERQRQQLAEDAQKGISEAIESVQEFFKEEDFEIPTRLIRGLLHDEANEDPRFLRAFQNRRQSPGSWKTILKKKAQGWKEEIDLPKKNDQTERMVASVKAQSRGNQKTGSDEPDYNSMTDAEFAKHKRGLLGQ